MSPESPDIGGSGGIDLNLISEEVGVVSCGSLVNEGIGLVGEEGKARLVAGNVAGVVVEEFMSEKGDSGSENPIQFGNVEGSERFDGALPIIDVSKGAEVVRVRGNAVNGIAGGAMGSVEGGGVEKGAVSGTDGNVQISEQESSKKRGRGRPRKSLTEKPVIKDGGLDVNTGVSSGGVNDDVVEVDRVKVTKKRGRGRKSLTEKPVIKDGGLDVNTGVSSGGVDDDIVEVDRVKVTKKRGRGRPSKCDANKSEREVLSVKFAVEENSERRKRGRPRKYVLENERLKVAERSGGKPDGTDEESREEGKTQQAGYSFVFQDEKKDGFDVSDIVWGKVSNRYWWPGQIFDFSCASKMASDVQKAGQFLVAYFADKTFAWCDESRLRHFQTYFSQMEKLNFSDSFRTAVEEAVEEVSRRVQLTMTCNCFADKANAGILNKKVDNSGIKDGTYTSAGDRTWIINSFDPNQFMEHQHALAVFPNKGASRLDLAIINAQINAFHRSKDYPDYCRFFLVGGGLVDEDDGSAAREEKSDLDFLDSFALNVSHSSTGKEKSETEPRSSLSGKRKHLATYDTELMKNYNLHRHEAGEGSSPRKMARSSRQKFKAPGPDSIDLGKTKKRKTESLGDMKYVQPDTDHQTPSKSSARGKHRREDLITEPPVESEVSRAINALGEYAVINEVLSDLHSVAANPLDEHSILFKIVDFFTAFKTWLATSKDEKHVEVTGNRRSRKKTTELLLATTEPAIKATGCVQDSYWSDIILSDPEEAAISEGQKGKIKTERTQRKMMKTHEAGAVSGPIPTSSSTEHDLEAEKPLRNLQFVEECMPTELVLTFCDSYALPSVDDLVRTFGQYGPLREAETKVLESENIARVIFKRGADADLALSGARQYSLFGQASVGYRLRSLEPAINTFPDRDTNFQ